MTGSFQRRIARNISLGTVVPLMLPLGLAALAFVRPGMLLSVMYLEFFASEPLVLKAFIKEGIPGLVNTFQWLLLAGSVYMTVAHVSGLFRRPWSLNLMRAAYVFLFIICLFYGYVVGRLTEVILAENLSYGGVEKFDRVLMFHLRWKWFWPAFLVMGLCVWEFVYSMCRRTALVYRAHTGEAGDAPGDAFIENLRSNGRDPRFRKSVYSSLFTHLMVMVIIPWLLQIFGCVTPYRVPKGSGNPVVAMVAVMKPKKEKKKQYILNPNSMISFKVPEIDDSEIFNQVVEASKVTYTATANAKAGKMGAGGGKEGGWPDGMENHLVRFIRMKYSGPGWNDGMDEGTGSDRNFLERFHKLTGFKVAKSGEAHAIRLLSKYPKGYAPPFVYMTGAGSIGGISQREKKILREYLLGGGLLIGDAGSPHWASSFRHFISTVFPDKALLVIASDDPIFQMPYQFPDGAPPLWHHGGYRAMGISHNGRWIVFFHPGDMNDAWKTGGSGLSPQMADGGYQMGVNLVYYAFTHYLQETRKYRK